MTASDHPPQHSEIRQKIERLTAYAERHKLDGVLLQRRANFAWITGGRDNHIANSSPAGVAFILFTVDDGKRVCFTNKIEAPRFGDEELAGTGIDVVSYPWYDAAAAARMLRELIGDRRIAADPNDAGDFNHFSAGLLRLPEDFVELRWPLTDAEIARYREGGRRTSRAIELACRFIKVEMTEHEIAGILDHEVHTTGCNPVVTLVAADERIEKFRHPIPTGHRLQRYVMLVTCAEYGGLISNMTRFVHFGPIPADLKAKHQAVCNVDATVNLSTRAGKTLGEMFDVIRRAYAENGYPGEEANHHQGGSTGYAGRDVFATPDSAVRVLPNQAFAWNPSITGTKSEDTILVTSTGIELLTTISQDWPKITGRSAQGELMRADMLVM